MNLIILKKKERQYKRMYNEELERKEEYLHMKKNLKQQLKF